MFAEFISMAATDVSSATATLHSMAPNPELKAITDNIHRQTAGPAGDMHVELQSLVDFYNTLSQLHDELADTIVDFRATADKLAGVNVGGKVVGVQQAWQAMTQSLGASNERNSLVGNLQAVDNEVVKYMAALQHNAQAYAEQEDATIKRLGRAQGTGEPKKHHKKDDKHAKGHAKGSSKNHGTATGMVVEGGGVGSSFGSSPK